MGRGIVKLADDQYVIWSTVVDAPVSYVLTQQDLLIEDPSHLSRINRADTNGHSFLDSPPGWYGRYNRAGPNECCLTKEAILKRFASQSAYENFVLTAKDLSPYTTWDDGKSYWIPWEPGKGPPDDTIITEKDSRQRALVLE